MLTLAFTSPGDPVKTNEDWTATAGGLTVVLDGATVRTDTGCIHDVAWYTRHLGTALLAAASDPHVALTTALADAITAVTARHGDTCDLSHPGTPSAAVGVVRIGEAGLEYLVLGDVTLVIEVHEDGEYRIKVITDQRISDSAATERAEVDRHLIGTQEKADALIPMKVAELSARNTPDGYWIASTDPAAVEHAITGTLPTHSVIRLAMLTDGAARIVDLFGLCSWSRVLRTLEGPGPSYLVRQVRDLEDQDPVGETHPRNKKSDDATVVFLDPHAQPTKWAGVRPGRVVNDEIDFDDPEVQASMRRTLDDFREQTHDPDLTGQDIAGWRRRRDAEQQQV